MTPAPNEASADNIAWMRNLAEEGGRTPMQSGVFLLTAGLFYGLASLFHWAVAVGATPLTIGSAWIGWAVATVAYWIFLAVAIPRARRRPGVYTAANKATGIAWSAAGWGIFALFLAMAVLGWRLDAASINAIFTLVPSVILVFYGVGWAVSAMMHQSRAMWILMFGSFGAAVAMAVFAGSAAQFLAYAAALFALATLPGYLFMRAAGRT